MDTMTTTRGGARAHRATVRTPRRQPVKATPSEFAVAMARLTEVSKRDEDDATAMVLTSDLRMLLDAYGASHQAARVAAGASAETFEQVLARRAKAAQA